MLLFECCKTTVSKPVNLETSHTMMLSPTVNVLLPTYLPTLYVTSKSFDVALVPEVQCNTDVNFPFINPL